MIKDYSILIGGKAGDGIKKAGSDIAELFNASGYWVFIYEDYPSIIRGGHNFSIIRGASEKIMTHQERVDILIALDQNTVDKHISRLKKNSLIVFDSNIVKAEGLGLPLSDMVKKMNLPSIARNSAVLGAVAGLLGSDFSAVEKNFRESLKSKQEENISVAREAYELAKKWGNKFNLPASKNSVKTLITGNEAIALGAVKGGLQVFVAYPMTPSTSILHYLASNHKKFNIKVIHPESEIAVIGMAEGAAYAGKRTAVGTSGGGFALMVEHISLAGQAEIPLVIFLVQRPGPATGLPTYTAQGDLFFALHAGHGEFPKIVSAPGDPEEAIAMSADAMNLAWQFQVPVIVLSDKHLSESTFSSEPEKVKTKIVGPKLWDKNGEYKRYALTSDGISPMAFPGFSGAIIKSNSYEHDERGITTEEAEMTNKNVEKRMKKSKAIEKVMKKMETVKVYGNKKSKNVLLVWGSTKGSAIEATENLKCKVVQPLYMEPFPVWELKKVLKGARRIIGIETNAKGQLCDIMERHGFKISKRILKYDGRPFTPEELEKRIKKAI